MSKKTVRGTLRRASRPSRRKVKNPLPRMKMAPKPALAPRKEPAGEENATRTLLLEGLPANVVAERTGKNRRSIFEYASRHQLPTNPPIHPGSPQESRVIRNLVASNFNVPLVAKLHSHTEANIQAIWDRIKTETPSP